MRISSTGFVSHNDPIEFHQRVDHAIKELQKHGCTVEVQYEMGHGRDPNYDDDGFLFTALLLGRKEV